VGNDHTAVSQSSFVPIKNLENVFEAFQIYHMGKMYWQDGHARGLHIFIL
jgi:hypothetical protein